MAEIFAKKVFALFLFLEFLRMSVEENYDKDKTKRKVVFSMEFW